MRRKRGMTSTPPTPPPTPPCLQQWRPLLSVLFLTTLINLHVSEAKLADRSRVVKMRKDAGIYDRHRDFGRPIEGQAYRALSGGTSAETRREKHKDKMHHEKRRAQEKLRQLRNSADSQDAPFQEEEEEDVAMELDLDQNEEFLKPLFLQEEQELQQSHHLRRRTSNQLTGCCSNYQNYGSDDMCALYGYNCAQGDQKSHDSGDADCSLDGLSFIGISFSVNTAYGNPYSYQLCDQFPMGNIIDRDYDNIMSMDEDGWLVGGGYKQFDYCGKMPYIDSSHTELLRIGSLDPDRGGTTISQVYSAMANVEFEVISIYPEKVKTGGGHHSGDNDGDGGVASCDVTLGVSVVEKYYDDDAYSGYEYFLMNLFDAMDAVGGGPCMDDEDTDPHVSMARGVKFKSSDYQQQYLYTANLEVAVWQAMYPYGTPIGSNGYAAFPPGAGGTKQYVGYGALYFFFDRANITMSFPPSRELSEEEEYYATLFTSADPASYYSAVNDVGFNYAASGSGGQQEYEHNPYQWKSNYAIHDFTDGWDLPPDCYMEGETFLGIPLSQNSGSKLQATSTYQNQFDFDMIIDRNNTYIKSFGTNHGWLVGEEIGNAAGSIVDKDTAHLPIFYLGTTNANMGGMTLTHMIKVVKTIEFGVLYIKPAFVFVDEYGHIKLQFEADAQSSLGYLYDNLCKMLGINWNYQSPYNTLGYYTNCAMHAAGDRAQYGCGPDNAGSGGFCPQVTLAYKARFVDEDSAAAYLQMANAYVDYWRQLYPTGVAVGTDSFCSGSGGGCLALFLNRYDVYYVFGPDLSGAWVAFNSGSAAPTVTMSPTWEGGCDNPMNHNIDRCYLKNYHMGFTTTVWESLGKVGQFSMFLILVMGFTLTGSVFFARAKKRKKKDEGYMAFLWRDMTRKKKKKRLRSVNKKSLAEPMLEKSSRSSKSKSRSRSQSRARRSRSRSRSRARSSANLEKNRSTDVSDSEGKKMSRVSSSSDRRRSSSKKSSKSTRSSSRSRRSSSRSGTRSSSAARSSSRSRRSSSRSRKERSEEGSEAEDRGGSRGGNETKYFLA